MRVSSIHSVTAAELDGFQELYDVACGSGSKIACHLHSLASHGQLSSFYPRILQESTSTLTVVCVVWSKHLYAVACTSLLGITIYMIMTCHDTRVETLFDPSCQVVLVN